MDGNSFIYLLIGSLGIFGGWRRYIGHFILPGECVTLLLHIRFDFTLPHLIISKIFMLCGVSILYEVALINGFA